MFLHQLQTQDRELIESRILALKSKNRSSDIRIDSILKFAPDCIINTTSVLVSHSHNDNRCRLMDRLCQCEGVPGDAVVVLQGGEQKQRYCTDTDVVFRQVGGSMQFSTLLHVHKILHAALFVYSKSSPI